MLFRQICLNYCCPYSLKGKELWGANVIMAKSGIAIGQGKRSVLQFFFW